MSFKKDTLSFLNGFRKFTIMLIIIIIAVLFRIFTMISGAELVDLIKVTGVAFFGTNAAEHLIKTTGEWLKNMRDKK